jgi:hypothetical protein
MQLGRGDVVFTGVTQKYPGHRLPLGVKKTTSYFLTEIEPGVGFKRGHTVAATDSINRI